MIYPTNFEQLYQCDIKRSGKTLRHTTENEISIKMPESEYVRFVENWDAYMSLLRVAQKSPEFKEQFQHILAMASIYS